MRIILATVAVAALTINVANAAVADGCVGFGSSLVEWIEQSAAKFSAEGKRFGSADAMKDAVKDEVDPKLREAWRELRRQQGNGPQFYPPNLIRDIGTSVFDIRRDY